MDYAPHRGNEIFEIIQNKLQEIATGKGVVVVHRFEAATIKGKNLIQRQNGYEWKKRSTEGYSIYERKFLP